MSNFKVEKIVSLGEVRVTKKRGLKRISMRLHHSGQIRVSIPYYLPFSAGFAFAKSQNEWVTRQQSKERPLKIYRDMQIGKGYKYLIVNGDKLSSRVSTDEIIITKPSEMPDNDKELIYESKKAIKRALSKEAKDILPERVKQLAKQYDYSISAVNTKPMKTRWGSCSSEKLITLNIYLLMMPWPIIDYVILHELAHTKQMNHSKDFWAEVSKTVPNYKDIKKQLKSMQPDIYALYL